MLLGPSLPGEQSQLLRITDKGDHWHSPENTIIYTDAGCTSAKAESLPGNCHRADGDGVETFVADRIVVGLRDVQYQQS